MKIYVDAILLLNFGFDFLLLLATSYLLKRNISIYKIIIGALFGSLSILFLFLPISSFSLFLFKIVISVGMILITFSFKNIHYFFKNIIYLYFNSMLLGGFLYLLNIPSGSNNGFIEFTIVDKSIKPAPLGCPGNLTIPL